MSNTRVRVVTELADSDYTNSVIYFTAPWCGPCRMLGPIMDELSNNYESLNFLKVDVDESQDIAIKHKVSSIPTVMLYINGDNKKTFVGLNPKRAYEAAFGEYSEVNV